MNAIATFALEKFYLTGFWRKHPKQALKPLTLEVPEGEIFGYLGPNGAGKTTTLRLLMGLVKPTAGSSKILNGTIEDPAIRAQIGFLPEQPYFYDYLTAVELLTYYAQLSGVPAGERQRRVASTLDRVGLAKDAVHTQLRKFSKGMLQRVGIAQAILHQPKLVFLDEPMSGLDPIGRREVRDLIASLKDEGKTVFFSTHILSDAEALCDRVAIVANGELRGVGAVAEMTSSLGGNMEVVWEGEGANEAIKALGRELRVAGAITRSVVPESMLNQVLDILRAKNARIISVTPVRATLEDYFLQKLAQTSGGAD
ncbi:MAG TPA: ABC transporter ATP-binding protein [Terriglobales bacterium]|nr:ABC transporter ATP-binding protein [Terriglobales bacterium]